MCVALTSSSYYPDFALSILVAISSQQSAFSRKIEERGSWVLIAEG
jgi:hypothetical protein